MKMLIVDDDEVTRNLLSEVMLRQGHEVTLAASGEEALRILKSAPYPVILSDIRMLEVDGMMLLRQAKAQNPRSAVILMTGFGSVAGAIEAIQQGAFDYVSKPFKMDTLKEVIARAVRHVGLAERGDNNPKRSDEGRSSSNDGMLIGRSPLILEVYKRVARAAMVMSPVLLYGENGVGKRRVARAIHEHGPRRAAPWVRWEGEPLEAAFAKAQGGTLYLPGLSRMPAAAQAALASALQEESQTGVRVIAAAEGTAEDLEAAVKAGKFREDLFYRLRAIQINVPPLRERMEDLPELAEGFLVYYSARNGKKISHFSEAALELLREYRWPGNVRELEHAIESAVALAPTEVLDAEDFPVSLRMPGTHKTPAATGASPGASLEDLEKSHILTVLESVRYNKSRASEVLGIDRATLYRKAQRYGIDLKAK